MKVREERKRKGRRGELKENDLKEHEALTPLCASWRGSDGVNDHHLSSQSCSLLTKQENGKKTK